MEKLERSILLSTWRHRLLEHLNTSLTHYLMISVCFFRITKIVKTLPWDWAKYIENIAKIILNRAYPKTNSVNSQVGERNHLNLKILMTYQQANRTKSRNFFKKRSLLKVSESVISLQSCNNCRGRGIGWIKNSNLLLIDIRKKILRKIKEFKEFTDKIENW